MYGSKPFTFIKFSYQSFDLIALLPHFIGKETEVIHQLGELHIHGDK